MAQVLAPVGIGSNNGEVVALPDGGYMVVWTHLVNAIFPIPDVSDTQFEAILGRTFNADGTPRGEVFQVNQSLAASGQSRADIDVLANGNVVVVWQDGPSLEAGNVGAVEAYGRVFTSAGVAVTDEIQLSTNTENDQRLPKVVADDRGGFVTVWVDGSAPFSNSSPGIMAQRFDADGSRIGPQIYVNPLNDQDMELLYVGDGVVTIAKSNYNITFDLDDTYLRSDGLIGASRAGAGGESNYNFGFGFNDDAVQVGDTGYVALNAGLFAPNLTFWSTQEVRNNQVSNFADGTPPSETVPSTSRDPEAVVNFVNLTFNGEERPTGVDYYPNTTHWAAVAATEMGNGDIVVAWTAVSGGTRDVPVFSIFAATLSAEGILLSETVEIAQDVQGTGIAPPFIAAGANDQVFIGWTGTTDRNGAGTNEIFGGTFDVPRNDISGQTVGTVGNDVITGEAGEEQVIYLRDGDDTFIQGELNNYSSGIYGMGGNDLFVMTDEGVARSIIPGMGFNTLDLSTATTGQNVFSFANAVHDQRDNLDFGFGAIIGSFFDDTIAIPRALTLPNGTFDGVQLAYVHGERGDDTFSMNSTDHAGRLDGGDGFDVITTGFDRDQFELTFQGDHYTLGYLYQAYQSELPPAVRDGYLLEIRGVEEIQFADQTVALQATASLASGAYANAAPPTNTDPIAVTDEFNVDLLDTLVIPFADLLANDTDAEGDTLTVTNVNTAATNGRAQVVLNYTSAGGVMTSGYALIYTPTIDALGLETLSYDISDGKGGTAQGTIEITSSQSTPPNRAPVTGNDTAETAFGAALTVDLSELTANDSDPDGDPLSLSTVISASNGSAVINSAGGIDFTPDAAFSGTAEVLYSVRDSAGASTEAKLSITVRAPDNSAGSVTVNFGDANDVYTGSAQGDVIAGGLGDDTFDGGDGDDTLDGGAGFDALNGGKGDDVITDAMGATIDGGDGRDIATVQAGNNTFNDTGVVANKNSFNIDDTYRGGFANDNMSGGEGNDILVGDNDSLFFYGADTLDGGIGIDLLSGGFGADVFYFSQGDSTADGQALSPIMGAEVIGALDASVIDAELALANTDIRNLMGQVTQDFEVGIDIIQLAGFSGALQSSIQTDVSAFLTDTAAGVEFEAAGVRILFADISETELTAISTTDVFAFV